MPNKHKQRSLLSVYPRTWNVLEKDYLCETRSLSKEGSSVPDEIIMQSITCWVSLKL